MQDALTAWKQETRGFSEHFLLPHTVRGRWEDPVREEDPGRLSKHFEALSEKWRLPELRPVDLRHWVAGVCRRSGLSKQATAAMMGHDPTSGESMRDWYDAPCLEDLLSEQAERLPRGCLGALEPPEVELLGGLPPEAVGVLREFMARQCDSIEAMTRLEAIRKLLKPEMVVAR